VRGSVNNLKCAGGYAAACFNPTNILTTDYTDEHGWIAQNENTEA
jgi:hypothetical protein